MSADLRLGKWQDVLEDVTCDALLVDAPYSERTHSGHDNGSASANRIRPEDEKRLRTDKRTGTRYAVGVNRRKQISYGYWTVEDVNKFVDSWAPHTDGWMVSLTDHVLAPAWEAAMERVGRYTFSPLAYVEPGSRVRIGGDGPSQWSCQIVVSRPKTRAYASWGSLPGAYVLPLGETRGHEGVVGRKPVWLMRALVRDYSRPGDLICDPCAGGGTTLLAALMEGRRAVGAEMDPKHYEIARKRLAKGFTPPLIVDRPKPATQEDLFADGKGE